MWNQDFANHKVIGLFITIFLISLYVKCNLYTYMHVFVLIDFSNYRQNQRLSKICPCVQYKIFAYLIKQVATLETLWPFSHWKCWHRQEGMRAVGLHVNPVYNFNSDSSVACKCIQVKSVIEIPYPRPIQNSLQACLEQFIFSCSLQVILHRIGIGLCLVCTFGFLCQQKKPKV